MTTNTTAAAYAATKPASDEDIARAIALLSEGLLTRAEFHALTGIDPKRVPHYLADSRKLAAVLRSSLCNPLVFPDHLEVEGYRDFAIK